MAKSLPWSDGLTDPEIAKLFCKDRSQAVRLPQAFRFRGTRVRVHRMGQGILLEPLITDTHEWFAELNRHASTPFMPDSRDQPATSVRTVFSGSCPPSPPAVG